MKSFFVKIKNFFVRIWIWILSWFETHQYLYVSHNQYNTEGEIIDVLEKKFTIRKLYKCTHKHMKFKTMDGNIVIIKTATPMDYMTETIE